MKSVLGVVGSPRRKDFNCPENRAEIRGKPAAIAVPFEEEDPGVAALLVSFFEKCFQYLEMQFVGEILVPGVGEKGEILEKPNRLEEGYELGRRLALI